MAEPIDVDKLPPTQYLVLEVLAARYRTGEELWPFPSRVRPALVALEQLGLIQTMHGNVPATLRARLTEAGRRAVLSDTYAAPLTLPVPHDPGDGRTECDTCGKYVWTAIHSCKRVPLTSSAMKRYQVRRTTETNRPGGDHA